MSNLSNRSIISIKNLSKEEIKTILKTAKQIKSGEEYYIKENKILANCFFEPSTRTRLSFSCAMKKLGGATIGFNDTDKTSIKKGESLKDTIRVVSGYSDIVIIRHPKEKAPKKAKKASISPVINAGDGSNEHPTQALLDLFSIKQTQNKIDGLEIALVGDLKYGRTIHSLTLALSNFNINLHLIAPNKLQLQDKYINKLKECGVHVDKQKQIKEEVLNTVDILYMTRIQQERFEDRSEYERLKNYFQIRKKDLKDVKQNMKILHPLPRVNEISPEVDKTEHAYYFQQAENGLYLRQALIWLILAGN